ncbi:NB-ARC domain-containing protein [Actinoplanes sp. NPDC048967]|uniref:NB-ARC domain-containing protein n=1 Tax=Actinoplanes sp. NPDC048967 TaxID=3155269 RepID=UPI0033F3CA74
MARFAGVAGATIAGAVITVIVGIAVNVATGSPAPWFPTMDRHPIAWLVGATLAGVATTLLAIRVQRRYDQGLADLVPAPQRSESWVVDRPAELAGVTRALGGRNATTVGITTAVHGAGGFGKTTVARLVCSDRHVWNRFGGRIYWVTLGRDVQGGKLVERVNDLLRRIDPVRAQPFTDVRQAAEHLATVLAAGPRRLIVVDDVWFESQADAFPVAGRSARLITTRVASLIPDGAVSVRVDGMSDEQARRVLCADLLQPPGPQLVDELLAAAGNWPLLLRLLNKILADQSRFGAEPECAAREILHQVRRGGLARIDEIAGTGLDLDDPDRRDGAVAATIEASTGLLSAADHERFAELAIFVEDEVIPISLVASLWQVTGGLSEVDTRALCSRLTDLALLSRATGDGTGVAVHDVIRDHLHRRLEPGRVVQLHGVLLDAVAPASSSWWLLPEKDRYLRDHLVEHLLAAGRHTEAEAVATDLCWVLARLTASGPLAPLTDLLLAATPEADRLSRLLAQIAHLLTPTQPAHSVADILLSRVAHDPSWGQRARAVERSLPALAATWALPDLPSPGHRMTLKHGPGQVAFLAAPRDGSWLVTAGTDGPIRIWDLATGRPRTTLAAHAGPLRALGVTADGTRIITVGGRRGIWQVWDAVTGELCEERAAAVGRNHKILIAPDTGWLVSLSRRNNLEVRNVAGGRSWAPRELGKVIDVAMPHDAEWLAVADRDGRVGIWDTATGRLRYEVAGAGFAPTDMVSSPDGDWLAVIGADGSVRIWDVAERHQRHEWSIRPSVAERTVALDDGRLVHLDSRGGLNFWDVSTGLWSGELAAYHHAVTHVTVSEREAWMASAARDGTVRIWDRAAGTACQSEVGPTPVTSLEVSKDGRRLVVGKGQRFVHRDADTGVRLPHPPANGVRLRHPAAYRSSKPALTCDPQIQELVAEWCHDTWPDALAIAPDRSWIAMARDPVNIEIWDLVTRRMQDIRAVRGDPKQVNSGNCAERRTNALAVAPDGTWLASVGNDGAVRLWKVPGLTRRARLPGRTPLHTVAIAPDGNWLVAAGPAGPLRRWDVATGGVRVIHPGGHTALAVAPDGEFAGRRRSGRRGPGLASGRRAGRDDPARRARDLLRLGPGRPCPLRRRSSRRLPLRIERSVVTVRAFGAAAAHYLHRQRHTTAWIVPDASSDWPPMVRPSSLRVVAMVARPPGSCVARSGSTTVLPSATSTARPCLSGPTCQPWAFAVFAPIPMPSISRTSPVRTFQRTAVTRAGAFLSPSLAPGEGLPPSRPVPSVATPVAQPLRMLKARAVAAGLPPTTGIGSSRWVPSGNQTYGRSSSRVPTAVPSSSMSVAWARDVPAGTGSRIGSAVAERHSSAALPVSLSPTIAPASLIASAEPRRTPGSFATLPSR